ncbi:hypothetical protein C427_5435 [Paraglaciecola psychrophila 170]|uniref:Uncharacterized protein n=1 Tax=Paraglaciecola psychrophila 170 TaxID=1129794 RepID=K6ZVS4_9ALTE|nr:hypothetical protein C427_5435 [Paraglaciecola psychrophila 170]GAC39991.1 hypothetical protein GPSY_4388 [Paraglaciecola psychrophila 170]
MVNSIYFWLFVLNRLKQIFPKRIVQKVEFDVTNFDKNASKIIDLK